MKRRVLVLLSALAILALVPAVALADDVPNFDFATPLFGLAAAPDGSLLVADTGAGIVELRHGEGNMVAFMPGVTDVAPIGRSSMFAITGGGEDPTAGKVFRVSRGSQRELADLKAYEEAYNPDGGEIDSNPFDVAALSGEYALVADAGGNSLLMVDDEGNIDLVATLPPALASTANVKALVGCPAPPPDLAFACDLPEMIPAEAVGTSVAIGPDGAYYVGELKGFPAPVGESKVWRIEPGTLNADCGTSPACSVVYSDFTSIIDLAFGPDGTLYVVEFEESTWLAAELYAFYGVPVALQGGTISACDSYGGGCSEVLASVMFPTAVAVDKKGAAYATVAALIPGAAQVVALP